MTGLARLPIPVEGFDLVLFLVALSLAYAGLAALCLAMDRHHVQLRRREPSALMRRALRALGWPLVLLAAWPCAQMWGASIGAVIWVGVLSVAGLLLVVLQGYRPRLAASAALGLPAMTLVLVMALAGATTHFAVR